jgi:DNA-directed RNA polymerase subunit RPC12/RpoP
VYKCVNCKRIITKIEGTVRCPFCGARILTKIRPEVIKRVQAR